MQAQDDAEAEVQDEEQPNESDGYVQEWAQEDPREEELTAPSIDEFGRWKMDKFRAFAREVLIMPASVVKS